MITQPLQIYHSLEKFKTIFKARRIGCVTAAWNRNWDSRPRDRTGTLKQENESTLPWPPEKKEISSQKTITAEVEVSIDSIYF